MTEATMLVAQMATTAYNRMEKSDGREYLVAPVVALVEGVVNGEFISAEELSRYTDAWNGIPLPIGHPMEGDMPISANNPALADYHVGKFYNAHCDGTRLRGEVWLDVEKAKSLGGEALEVLNRLMEGKPLEVSTAYFRDLVPEEGKFNGKDYGGVQKNLRPDHLALLPSDIGACSWTDGCGCPRTNMASDGENDDDADSGADGGTNPSTAENKERGDKMTKELVDGLISNDATHWTEEDREFLTGLEKVQLEKMVPIPPAVNDEADEEEETADEQTEQPEDTQPKNFDEWVETIPDGEIREEMKANRKRMKERREKLISELASNKRNAFDKEELCAMRTPQLEKLAKMLVPEDYSGKAPPRTNRTADEDSEIAKPPPVILAKRESK